MTPPPATATTDSSATSTNYGFVIDNRRCIGCHACTVACKSEHQDPIGVNKTWVQYVETGVFPEVTRDFHVLRCNHCADAPCVEICPTACLETRGDGIVDFDPGRCIGCKACMQACPYDAITIHPERGTATKCNYCSHRVDEGREPACVVVCPVEAIVVGDLHDPVSKIAKIVAREDVSVRKPEKGTVPNLFYVEGDAAALNPSAARMSTRTLWGVKPEDGTASPEELAPQKSPAEVRQGARRTYDIAQRHAGSWGWKVSAYLFTKSIAAGAFLVPALAFFIAPLEFIDEGSVLAGVWTALVALAITGALLVADLKRPERFLWVLLRPQWRSWLVKGAYIITGYGGFLTAWALFAPSADAAGVRWAAAVGGALALGTAVYSGWLFGQAKGRDLWQSSLVPFHLGVQALLAGVAWFAILSAFSEVHGEFAVHLEKILLINAAIIGIEVWGRHATADGSRAARLMRSGGRGVWLVVGCLLIGHGGAIALVLLEPDAIALAGVLALIGLLIYEHLWVEAPQRLPLA